MKLDEIRAAEGKLLLQTYERNPIVFTGGQGVYLRDENGVDYLDLLSGIGVSALGYGHSAIENAIVEQSRKVLHISNLFFHPGQAQLAARLTRMSGLDRAFFCNSGTEAWEAALKLARAYAQLRRTEGSPVGTKILALHQSFHGRTMGSVSTTHKDKYRDPFAPLIPGVEFVRFNDVADLRAKFSDEVCCVCIEAIQGEGGIRPVSQAFFDAARGLTRSTGALLIADEIQSGLGRTGKWFAYQHYGITPDIITVAKPIANGLPLGAMLCTEEAARAMTPGMHGTTFGGGPLVTAVALAVLDTLENDGILAHVSDAGTYFRTQLLALARKHESILEVRGMGLMLGMEMANVEVAKHAAAELLRRHIIINRTSDTVLRFLPPFILERKHIDCAVAELDSILSAALPQLPSAAVLAGGSHG